MTRTRALWLTVLFGAGLAVVPALTWLAPGTSVVPHEKRERAPRPGLPRSRTEWSSLPERAEAWLGDHLGLRHALVRLRHAVGVGLLRTSPSEDVLVGRDGWLYLGGDHGLASIRAQDPFEAAELEAWAELLIDTERWLRQRGVAFVVVLAPNKASVHPESLPPGLRPASARSRADQFVERLARTEVQLVDLRPALREAARRGPVYHRLDTHWNADGALAAYRAVATRLPGVTPLPEVAIERDEEHGSGDLSRMLHAGIDASERRSSVRPREPRAVRLVPDPEAALDAHLRRFQVYEVEDAALPRALVFRDSFATALLPLLREHFQRSVWQWGRTLDPALVEAERPDLVVFELVERYLMAGVPANAFREAGRLAASD